MRAVTADAEIDRPNLREGKKDRRELRADHNQ
jgi:hypothetical protein